MAGADGGGTFNDRPFARVNPWLEGFPRVRFTAFARPTPAFRACGIAGYYAAIVVTIATGLARGRDLAVLAALCAVCGVSFYAYALARKWITGREKLVLLEHVWFAIACCVAALFAMREPLLGYLDDVACGLAVFLTFGRIGCFLVGCCHGVPSACGVRYGHVHAREGFTTELVGVRLFPVQLVEATGLAAIGAGCAAFALLGGDGSAVLFFAVGYSVLRFGLEALRADPRPSFAGISQARWMVAIQAAVALALAERARPHVTALEVLGAIGVFAWLVLVGRGVFGLRARALGSAHARTLRDAARSAEGEAPVALAGPLGFAVAVSHGGRILSLSGPVGARDVPLLCDVACAVFPELDAASATLTPAGVLVAELRGELLPERPASDRTAGFRLFARLAYAAQGAEDVAPAEPPAPSPDTHAAAGESRPDVAAPVRQKQWYFTARPSNDALISRAAGAEHADDS